MDYTFINDLDAHISELMLEGHPTDHVKGRAIFTDERVKVLALPFHAGQSLDEHTAPHPAILHFLKGQARVTLGVDSQDVRAGSWMHMPAHLPHSIHAKEDTVMLLIILHSD